MTPVVVRRDKRAAAPDPRRPLAAVGVATSHEAMGREAA
jgi:hypothetical protein